MDKLGMCKKEKVKFFIIFFALLSVFFIPFNVDADSSNVIKPLLKEIKAWSAEKAEGMSMNMGEIKMINASRSYKKNGNTIDVVIIVGSAPMIQGHMQMPQMNIDSSEGSMNIDNINGFKVFKAYDKKEKEGHIMVFLFSKAKYGSIFMFNYSGISSEKALKIAEGFDWKNMKNVTSGVF